MSESEWSELNRIEEEGRIAKEEYEKALSLASTPEERDKLRIEHAYASISRGQELIKLLIDYHPEIQIE